jgi:hypothetical protein
VNLSRPPDGASALVKRRSNDSATIPPQHKRRAGLLLGDEASQLGGAAQLLIDPSDSAHWSSVVRGVGRASGAAVTGLSKCGQRDRNPAPPAAVSPDPTSSRRGMRNPRR